MQAISRVDGKISRISNNMEKYISFFLGRLRFIGSAQFLLISLDRLVAASKPEDFHITAKYERDDLKRRMFLRKVVYPYQYMDSWGRFSDENLRPREAFYGKVSDKEISDKD